MNAGDVAEGVGDVNAVVSYNLGIIRDRWGWTQDQLLGRLARLTERELSHTAVSAVAAAFAPGPHRVDAHELYLLSVVFEVPITYFFVPPPGGAGPVTLADTGRPIPCGTSARVSTSWPGSSATPAWSRPWPGSRPRRIERSDHVALSRGALPGL